MESMESIDPSIEPKKSMDCKEFIESMEYMESMECMESMLGHSASSESYIWGVLGGHSMFVFASPF